MQDWAAFVANAVSPISTYTNNYYIIILHIIYVEFLLPWDCISKNLWLLGFNENPETQQVRAFLYSPKVLVEHFYWLNIKSHLLTSLSVFYSLVHELFGL